MDEKKHKDRKKSKKKTKSVGSMDDEIDPGKPGIWQTTVFMTPTEEAPKKALFYSKNKEFNDGLLNAIRSVNVNYACDR